MKHQAGALDLLRRDLTSTDPARLVFTRIALQEGSPAMLAFDADGPLTSLRARLFNEADGGLLADLGDIGFEPALGGGYTGGLDIPSDLRRQRVCVVLEGRAADGRRAGCEIGLPTASAAEDQQPGSG